MPLQDVYIPKFCKFSVLGDHAPILHRWVKFGVQ